MFVDFRFTKSSLKVRPYYCRKYEKYCVVEECESTIDDFIYTVDSADLEAEESHLCTVCGVKFSTKENLHKHSSTTHSDDTFTCDVCSKVFKSKYKLMVHTRNTHRSSNDSEVVIRQPSGKFRCVVCDKEFCRKMNASQHFMTHVAEKSLKCDECDFKCYTQTQLDVHKKKHDKRFCCEICSKMFAYKFQLEVHVQGVHYNLRPFTCKTCGKTFKTRYNYGSHMAQHKDIRNFQCPFCPRKCRKSYDLRIHIRTHTGERPYICTYCNRGFSQNGDRLKHEKHCYQKTDSTQIMVERYPDNEIMEVLPAKVDADVVMFKS